MKYLLRPYHICGSRNFFWANEQWFEGIAPTRDQVACPVCNVRFSDPRKMNHISIESNEKEGITYKNIWGTKVDKRKKGYKSVIRVDGSTPIKFC